MLPILLVTHITLAILLFLPSILLPFALRTRRATVDSDSRVVRGLLWGQSHGTMIIGAGLALTGLWLVAALAPTLLAACPNEATPAPSSPPPATTLADKIE